MLDTLQEFADAWEDTPVGHLRVHDQCLLRVESDRTLLEHRTAIETDSLGCGARAFHWLWHLLVQEAPRADFKFLEIGVLRGQVISLVSLLAQRRDLPATVVGVSTFDGRGMFMKDDGQFSGPEEIDDHYAQTVLDLYERFGISTPPALVYGDSTNPETVERVRDYFAPFDVVYVDGSHEYADARKDLLNYAPMVNVGGYLLADDAGLGLNLHPSGLFAGWPGSTAAFDELLPPITPAGELPDGSQWAHAGSIAHLRIWRRTR